jgi:hypothetical protein
MSGSKGNDGLPLMARSSLINRVVRVASAFRYRFMLQTIAIILLILWVLGYVSSYTMGGFIHILLVVAVVMLLVRLIQGSTRS